MNGYLSRIARQSGHRFTGHDKVSPTRAREPRPVATVSPDREDTVMVTPSAVKKNAESSVVNTGRSQEISSHENGGLEPGEEGEPSEPGPGPSLARSVTEIPAGASPENKIPTKPIPEYPQKKDDRSEGKGLLSEASDASSHEISQTILARSPAAADTPPIETARDVIVKSSAIDNQRANQSHESDVPLQRGDESPVTSTEKHYFAETTEIIEGRDAQPEEVQTILLREVQEWVTAGEHPRDIDIPMESSSEEIETQEVVRMAEPEPGVVRIGQKRSSESIVRESEDPSPRIEEQSFDLSIGTISVVIEGDEKPLQHAPEPQSRSKQDGQEASNRFSRLKRSFL